MSNFSNRRSWFDAYFEDVRSGIRKSPSCGMLYTCPCCGYPTLSERGGYDICEICFWEDDGQDDPNADEVWGGPNKGYSLTKARENFASHQSMFDAGKDPRGKLVSRNLPMIQTFDEMLTASEERLEVLWEVACK